MRTISTIADLREALAEHRRAGRSIGLVPTMGYLHVGHMELVRRAGSENDVVVASIFVNPLQFGANEDLGKYPRDLARDQALLTDGGVDFLFAPAFPTCIRARWKRWSTCRSSAPNSKAQ